jgi:hypothetical protein
MRKAKKLKLRMMTQNNGDVRAKTLDSLNEQIDAVDPSLTRNKA